MKNINNKFVNVLTVAMIISCNFVAAASAVTEPSAAFETMKNMPDEVEIKEQVLAQALGRSPKQAEAELLVSALNTGNISVLEKLLEAGIDINTPAVGDGTPLMIASAKGNLDMVESLLSLGANPNAFSEGDGNALIVAAKMNHADIAKRLLESGADINAIVAGDETALITASRFDNVAMVGLLLDNGADVNLSVVSDQGELRSPLNQAKSEAIRTLLKRRGAK